MPAECALAEVRAQYVRAGGGGYDGAEESAREVPRHHLGEGHFAVGHEAGDQFAPVPRLREAVGEQERERCGKQHKVDFSEIAGDRLDACAGREPYDNAAGGGDSQPPE